MEFEDLENKLNNMTKPQFSAIEHQQNLKLAIINSRTSTKISLWLLSIPLAIFIGALLQLTIHISIPPWSWIHLYSSRWPLEVRMGIFMIVVIIIPFIVVIINLLSITWLNYDKELKVLNISIRIRPINMILLLIGAIIGGLFTIHSIIEWVNHAK